MLDTQTLKDYLPIDGVKYHFPSDQGYDRTAHIEDVEKRPPDCGNLHYTVNLTRPEGPERQIVLCVRADIVSNPQHSAQIVQLFELWAGLDPSSSHYLKLNARYDATIMNFQGTCPAEKTDTHNQPA